MNKNSLQSIGRININHNNCIGSTVLGNKNQDNIIVLE